MLFEDFSDYNGCEPAGVRLPKIKIDDSVFESLNLEKTATSYEVLKALVRKGIIEKGINKLPNKQEYYDRAKLELDTFEELGFCDYVLLNWEIIDYAKSNGIPVGEGRGSCCGSLVLYLIKVTNIDPIPHNLYFERFISKDRARKIVDSNGEEFLDGSGLMDVDNDISYSERQQVINFIENKHRGNTCKILTFNTFSSRLCIYEAVKFFNGLSEEESRFVSDLIPKKHGNVLSIANSINEVEKFQEWAHDNENTITQARKVEDLKKNYGQHPSGVGISAFPVEDIIPLQITKNGELISGYEMGDVSDLMVKFDILGLRTLTIADRACKKIGIKLEDIDPNDPFIYEQLQSFKSPIGLFQISAETNYRVAQEVKPTCLEELSDVVALARPSSLAFVSEYIKQKHSPTVLGVHPKLDEILSSSKNVVLYQETLLRIAKEIFEFDGQTADGIRRAVGKKDREKMESYKDRIFEKGKELGIENVSKFFWDCLNASADYAFNKCCEGSQLVITKDGEKEIKDVNQGDFIMSFNEDTKENEFVEVVDKVIGVDKEMILVEFECGRSIICSEDHKILTKEFGMISIKEVLKNNCEVIFDETAEYFKECPVSSNYLISNKGRLYSKKRIGRLKEDGSGGKIYGGSFPKGEIDKDGYIRVFLTSKDENLRKRFILHRLVAMTFIPNPENLPVVNHKNGIKLDNSIENLEWTTVTENNRHAYKTGLNSIEESTKRLPRFKGEKHAMSKLTEEDVDKMFQMYNNGSTKAELAKYFNVTPTTSGRILNGKSWKHRK